MANKKHFLTSLSPVSHTGILGLNHGMCGSLSRGGSLILLGKFDQVEEVWSRVGVFDQIGEV